MTDETPAPAAADVETPAVEPDVDANLELVDVEFIGDPAQHPLKGNINGQAYEYPYGQTVKVPLYILNVIEDAGYLFIRKSLPSSDGAALPVGTGQGDAGALSEGGSDGPGVNPDQADDLDLNALLDKSVAEIIDALPTLAVEQIDWLISAETNGKTRKSLIEALTKAKEGVA